MNDLERLAAPLVATPPIPPTPIGELRRRAARRTRRRITAIGVAALVVLIGAGTALGLSGREAPPVQVGTSPGTDVPAFDLRIYLNPDATPAQVAAISRRLLEDPNVTGLTYADAAASYAQFECLFSDQPQLIESVQPGDLPTNFGVNIVGGQVEMDRLGSWLHDAAGVKVLQLHPGSAYHILEPVQQAYGTVSYTIPPGAAIGRMQYQTSSTIQRCPMTGTTLR
jgi:hypothetical protein